MKGNLIVFGDFTSSFPKEFLCPFASETCGFLDIMITSDRIIFKHKNYRTSMTIILGSCCQSSEDNLCNVYPIITWTKNLHQVLREIKQTQHEWNIKTNPEKEKNLL